MRYLRSILDCVPTNQRFISALIQYTPPKIIQQALQALGRLAVPIVAVRGCFDISPYWHSMLPFLNAWDLRLQVSYWRRVPGAALWLLSVAFEETENMQLPPEELPRLYLSLCQRWTPLKVRCFANHCRRISQQRWRLPQLWSRRLSRLSMWRD